ncbi:MAG: acyloxyacyl hydrolase [Caulobacteraceae bacterium]|nr:acyloxyacyl hydrolase [Caulobacter sp.]
MITRLAALAAALGLLAAPAAHAADIFGGVYDHGLGTKQGQEGGVDIMLGVRSERIASLWFIGKPAVHFMVSANTQVPTDFVALGFDWPIAILHSPHWYIRPGIGFAGTTGEADVGSPFAPGITPQEAQRRQHLADTRIDFGSHDLFEPEIALGYRINERYKIEASYVHLSNGQILHSGKNQGLDDVGVRLSYKFN